MNQPYFTIISTLRNKYACFYDQLLDSIKNQTYSDFECIFINDEKANEWITIPDERFNLIIIEREYGLAVKRNIGISKAKGKYIIFCDADDCLPLNLLQTFKNVADKYDADMMLPTITRDEQDFVSNEHSINDANFIKDKNIICDIYFGRYLNNAKTLNNIASKFLLDGCWGRAYKNEIIQKNGVRFFEEPCRAEDALFNNDFVMHIESLYVLPDYRGYFWRVNLTSEMHKANSFFHNLNPFLDKLYNQLAKCDKKYSENLDNYSAAIMFREIETFVSGAVSKNIKQKEAVQLLKNLFKKGTVSYRLIRNKKVYSSAQKYIISVFIRIRAYRLLILSTKFLKTIEKIIKRPCRESKIA